VDAVLGSDGHWRAVRLLEGASFWGAVVLPVVAVGLLVIQPAGWVPRLAGVFAANVVCALAGHCHGLDC